MKTCKNCNIEVADEEIFCPKCGEMLLGCSVDNDSDDRRVGGNYIPPAQPEPMTVGDVMLGRRYGKRIIKALRVISVTASVLAGLAILACGILTILGRDLFKLPAEKRTLIGILALPTALAVGLLLYFIFNIALTRYENLSLIGRNTEAQLSLLENQSALISSLLDAMNENNRRVDVIGEMLDDVLRMEEKQVRTIDKLSSGIQKPEETEPSAVYEENLSLINENLYNGAVNTQTMLKRVENAVNNGLGKLYKMWYAALNRGAEPPEDELTAAPSPSNVPADDAEPPRKPHAPREKAQKHEEEPQAVPDASEGSDEPEADGSQPDETKADVPEPDEPKPEKQTDILADMDTQSSGELYLSDDSGPAPDDDPYGENENGSDGDSSVSFLMTGVDPDA